MEEHQRETNSATRQMEMHRHQIFGASEICMLTWTLGHCKLGNRKSGKRNAASRNPPVPRPPRSNPKVLV